MSQTAESIDYAQEWQDDLATLNTIQDGSTALEYCFTNLLPDLCGYYEQQMSELAEIMSDLTDCLNLVNEMQALFNEGSTYDINEDPNAYADYMPDVEEMMQDAQELEDLLEQDKDVIGESTVEDIETQLDSIFTHGTDYNDSNAVLQTSEDIITTWSAADKSDDDTQTAQNYSSDMQVYNDAFDAMTNDLSSMSSQVQSELQYVESEDQQMQGLISNMEQQWNQTMQVMTNNEITG